MRHWLQPIAERLDPIDLASLDAAAALRDRVDRKYLVPSSAVAEVITRLAGTHQVLEIGGQRVFTYETAYFDTPSLLTYREHLQGRRRRFKCRTRRYVESGRCAFEVKLKGPRSATVKRRMPHPVGLHGHLSSDAEAFVRHAVWSEYGRRLAEPLAPVLSMTYRRLTIADPVAGERVTLDADLRFEHGLPVGGGWLIVESKSVRGRAAADRVLRRLGVRPVSGCSKYCLGTSLVHPEFGRAPLRPVLRRIAGGAQMADDRH